MMHKLKIEELSVETFETAVEFGCARGTVHAQEAGPGGIKEQTAIEWTCLLDDCQPTFGYSCGHPDTLCCDY